MRCARMLWAVLAVTFFAALSATTALAQQTWWVQSADYGYKNQRQDVTRTVQRLVNGSNFRVNNTNMGVDPAKSKDKTLRIVARDSNGKVRDFYYKEGSTVNAQMFSGGPGSGYPGWGGGGRPGLGNGNNSSIRIVSAKWGFGAKQQDVASRLQNMIRNNRLSITVNVQTMGGDPIPGTNKLLSVIYDFGNRRRSKVVQEGQVLTLP